MTPDYHLELPSGQPVVHYRFGGRTVAYAGASGLRYVLGDQLGSDQGELNKGSDVGQTRYTPFGSDRAVSGSTSVTDEERYTGQRRVDDGGGNANRELYHYGARAYLPGVAVFTQPDPLVGSPLRSDGFNRYAYCLNNPLKYTDPTGLDKWWDGGDGGGDSGGDGDEMGEPPRGDGYMQPRTDPNSNNGEPSRTDMLPWSGDPPARPAPTAGPSVEGTPVPQATPSAGPTPDPVPSPAPGTPTPSDPPTTHRNEGGIDVYENVPWVGVIAGQGGAITLGPRTIAVHQTIQVGGDQWNHEVGHTKQAALLGPSYLPAYVELQEVALIAAGVAAVVIPSANLTPHNLNLMEIDANRRTGYLSWRWGG